MHAAQQDRSDVAAAGAQCKEKQPSLNPRRLFFLDETPVGANPGQGQYGLASRSERLVAIVPHGHCKTSTFIGCLHEGGMAAPCVLGER